MPLPPLARFLDPRPTSIASAEPIREAVNIPLVELPRRMHELAPRNVEILVAAPKLFAAEAVSFLSSVGRKVVVSEDWEFGERTAARLWRPNRFLEEVAQSLAAGKALDLACGSGRDAVFLAGLGWTVTAVDHLGEALHMGRMLADRYLEAAEAERITWRLLDLERERVVGKFDLVSTFWFLDREVIRQVPGLLRPAGSFIAETFTAVHRERFGKPRTESFVLAPGELPELVKPLEALSYEESWHDERHSARLWARSLQPV